MERMSKQDQYDQQQASLRRAEISKELHNHIPEGCFFCTTANVCKMRLATRVAMRGELTDDQAIAAFDEMVEGCPGTDDFNKCNSPNLEKMNQSLAS